MSHYFDTGFTVREPAWHGLGVVLDDYPRTTEEARIHSGLTWEPVLVPCYQRRELLVGMDPAGEPVVEHTFMEVDDARLVVRDDTHACIGSGVKPSYTPILNGTMFELLEAMAGEGAKIETAGSLRGGSVVWSLAYLDEPYTLPGDDSVSLPYIGVTNSHDGSAAMRAMATQVRIVCANTVQAANLESQKSGRYFEFRHTSNVMDRVTEAKAALAGARDDAAQWVVLATELLGLSVTASSYSAFIAEFIPEPPAGATSDRVKANIAAAREQFASLYNGPQNGAHNGTGLGLVNTAVEFLDHLRGYRTADTYLGRCILRPEPMKAKAVSLVREFCSTGA